MSRVIGLTGNIACGKTSVGRILLELGVERYIDADAIVHQLYGNGQPIALRVAEAFGPEFITADGSVDRKVLGARVFNDAEAMHSLERIVYPAVGEAVLKELSQVNATGIVVLDAVKLLEGKLAPLCQSIWVVTCPKEQQLARLMKRNNLGEQEAWARIRAQPPIEEKLPLINEVIDNGGSLEGVRRQVAAAFERFCSKFPA